ncbi:SRPBCC family protein [Streptomyces olivochromogenes]|uniref:SRPBCC family protein n=1 Tax=Streptomyces olivochromogenes TaxID=1963 RepID=UPI001F437688|nr:SRPBCC family protein [Streptomyces olivochromogenes]MCF3130496.1 SRPBCC family protein [Streptomyces olivochromogenes]
MAWSTLEPFDVSFFDTAPHRHSFPMDLPVAPQAVWAGLAGDTPLSWCRGLNAGRYTSPAPHGVGTTREITALRVLHLREEFVRWEEGTRHSFCVTQASLPLFRRFGEDYVVEPVANGTRFTWTFAFEPSPVLARPAALTDFPGRAFMKQLVNSTKRHFGAA